MNGWFYYALHYTTHEEEEEEEKDWRPSNDGNEIDLSRGYDFWKAFVLLMNCTVYFPTRIEPQSGRGVTQFDWLKLSI